MTPCQNATKRRTSDGKSHGAQDGHTGKLEETTTETTPKKPKRDSVQTKQVSRTLFCVVQLVVWMV